MMNENSPIWAMLIPAWTAVRVPNPARKAPTETPTTFPTVTTTTKSSTVGHAATAAAGSSSMPTATKNTAANKSRTGWTTWVTWCPTPDSAIRTPARKAPRATE